MSVKYTPVQWNRNKYWYDAVLLGFVFLYITLFIRYAPGLIQTSPIDGSVLRMRAFGSCAFFMLTFILCLGPLARLNTRFLPLLYNRRHFGVITFFVAFTHLQFVLGWYHVFTPVDRWVSLLSSSSNATSFLDFPIEWLGLCALVILFVMMATSHDFWLKFLTPPLWKTLHMGVYLAYGLLVMHVALGTLQAERSIVYPLVFGGSLLLVVGLHWAAAVKDYRDDRRGTDRQGEWVVAAHLDHLEENRGHTVNLPNGERAALFRYGNKISAISNVCAHQNGPLGEGCIIDGLVTCPWHGFQYRPEDGCSPAPFTEKVGTYRLKLDGARVLIDPAIQPPGTAAAPITLENTREVLA